MSRRKKGTPTTPFSASLAHVAATESKEDHGDPQGHHNRVMRMKLGHMSRADERDWKRLRAKIVAGDLDSEPDTLSWLAATHGHPKLRRAAAERAQRVPSLEVPDQAPASQRTLGTVVRGLMGLSSTADAVQDVFADGKS